MNNKENLTEDHTATRRPNRSYTSASIQVSDSESYDPLVLLAAMIETAENTMETFNYILKETYPDQFRDVPIFDTHIFYNRVLRADLLWDNSSALRYCPNDNNSSRIKRAVKFYVLGKWRMHCAL